MGRRTVLMLVAILVAALGSTLVFLYVQGINDRAIADQQPVEVLVATDVINPGESVEEAQAAGKLGLAEVPQANLLPDAMDKIDALTGQLALTTIYPGEQILPAKFGATNSSETVSCPKDTGCLSFQLTDYDRVAGFVQPGSHVAVFVCVQKLTGKPADEGVEVPTCQGVKLLLSDVEVVAVGSTSLLSTTTTDAETGAQTTEELPKAILTLALDQADAQKAILADRNGDLTFVLTNEDSNFEPGAATYYDSAFQ